MTGPAKEPDPPFDEERELERYAPPEVLPEEDGEAIAEPRPPIVSALGLWWLPTIGLLVGMLFIATDHMLRAGATVAVSLWMAAALRAHFPEDRAGGLVVRSVTFDVALLVLAGAAVALSAFTLDLRDLR